MPENDEQQQSGGGLRAQLEAALEEVNSLKQQVSTATAAQRELAFIKAGIDTENGVGKLLAKTYDGDLEPDSIKTFAQEYGIEVGEVGPRQQEAELDPAQARVDALRSQSQPDGSGQRLNQQEWLALSETDPAAARTAHAEGRVDLSPVVAQNLEANRQTSRLGG